MTNTTDTLTAAYESGSLAEALVKVAEDVLENRIIDHENWCYEDWTDSESARAFHDHLRSVRVWAEGNALHAASTSPGDYWHNTVSEILDAAFARIPVELQDRMSRENVDKPDPRIETLTPGHDVLYLW